MTQYLPEQYMFEPSSQPASQPPTQPAAHQPTQPPSHPPTHPATHRASRDPSGGQGFHTFRTPQNDANHWGPPSRGFGIGRFVETRGRSPMIGVHFGASESCTFPDSKAVNLRPGRPGRPGRSGRLGRLGGPGRAGRPSTPGSQADQDEQILTISSIYANLASKTLKLSGIRAEQGA